MGERLTDRLEFRDEGTLTIKCACCYRTAGFGEFASTNPEDTQETVAKAILERLGWQQHSWAGWLCPQHKRPTPNEQSDESQLDNSGPFG